MENKKLLRRNFGQSNSIDLARENGRNFIIDLLDMLRMEVGNESFMIVTKFLFSALHHIIGEPSKSLNRKFTTKSDKIKEACKLECMEDFLSFATLDLEGDFFVLEGDLNEQELDRLKLTLEILELKRKEVGELEAWALFLTDITRGKNIGAGAFGEVFEGTWNGKEVAIKSLKGKVTKKMKNEFFGEADLMKNLHHENVLSLIGVVLKKPYMIVMERMEINLQDFLRVEVTSLRDSLRYAKNIACGLDYLHNNCKIIHCDVAARNVLVSASQLMKIADFGQSRAIDSDECDVTARIFPIPVRWSPPELWEFRLITTMMDIWAFGVTFYEIMSGGLIPYSQFNINQVKSEVTLGYRLPRPPECPESFYDLMKSTWVAKAASRPTIKDIVATLESLEKSIAGENNATRKSIIRRSSLKATDAINEVENETEEAEGDESVGDDDGKSRRQFRQRSRGGVRVGDIAAYKSNRRSRGMSQADLTPFQFFTQSIGQNATEDECKMPSRTSFRRATIRKSMRKKTHAYHVASTDDQNDDASRHRSSHRSQIWFQGRRTMKLIKECVEPSLKENGDFVVHETSVPGEFFLSVLWDIPIHIRLWKDALGVIHFNDSIYASLTELIDFYESTQTPFNYARRDIILKNAISLEGEDDNLKTVQDEGGLNNDDTIPEEDDKEAEVDTFHFFMGCQVETDGSIGRQLYEALLETPTQPGEEELRCFLDQYDLIQVPGVDPWTAGLIHAIENSKVFIALLSEDTIKINDDEGGDKTLFVELENAIKQHKAGEMVIIPVFLGRNITVPHPTKSWKTFEVYDEFDLPDASNVSEATVCEMSHRDVVQYVLDLKEHGVTFNPFEQDAHILAKLVVEKAQDISLNLFAPAGDDGDVDENLEQVLVPQYFDKYESKKRRQAKTLSLERTIRRKTMRTSTKSLLHKVTKATKKLNVNLDVLDDSMYDDNIDAQEEA
eukprot:m.30019 g.30019  ORF g.30019 m.30019 type:complete len:957 (-) comp6197_c0_seq2:122-2992(-)